MPTNSDIIVNLKLDDSQYEKGMKSAGKTTSKFEKGTTTAFKAIGAVGTAVFATQLVGAVGEFLGSVSDTAVKLEGVEKSFKKLDKVNLDSLREATNNTVSDLELMQRTMSASQLGLEVSKLGDLFAFARQRAQETGQEVGYLVDSIVTGIGRKSPLILDNLGISAVALKEALNGASLEASSVADITEAVGKIASESMKNAADLTDTYGTKVEQLQTIITNFKSDLARGLFENDESKQLLEELIKTINENKGAILQFMNDWIKGAIKLAKYLAEVAGFWAEIFTSKNKTAIQDQIGVVSELNDKLNQQKRLLSDLEKGTALANNEAEIINAKNAVAETNKEYLYQQGLLNNLVNLKKAESKLEEAKKIKGGAVAQTVSITSNAAQDIAKAQKESIIKGSNISDEAFEMRKNVLAYEEKIQQEIKAKDDHKYALWLDKYNKEIEQIALDKKLAEQRNQMILSTATASINAVNSIVGIIGNESLNAFGKLTGAIGAGSGLLDMFMPGVGSLVGAGASLLGGLFGKKEEESASSSIASVSSSELASATTRPSATITRTGAENYYDYSKVIIEGNVVGDEQVFSDFVAKITGYQAKAAGGGL